MTGASDAAALAVWYGFGMCATTAQPPTNVPTLLTAIAQRHAGVNGRTYFFAILFFSFHGTLGRAHKNEINATVSAS